MRDGRGAEARLIGENAAANALGHGKFDGNARRAAGDGRRIERTLKDGGEHAGNTADIGKHHDERADDVDDRHAGHELFRDLADTLDAAEQHKRHEGRNTDTSDQADHRLFTRRVFIKRNGDGLDRVRDGMHLRDVADAKRRDRAEDGEHVAEPLPLRAETIFNIVHRAAAPVALFVALAIFDSQRYLGELRHHAKQCREPHPEHRAGAAENDGACDARDVARADGGGKCRGYGLQGRNFTVARLALLEDLANGIFPPVADLGKLDKAHGDAQVNARADEQCQHHRPPDKAVYRFIDGYKLFHTLLLPGNHIP